MRCAAPRSWLVGALACLLAGPAAHAACRVVPRATIKLTQVSGLLLLPVTLNSITADFIMDTGAERTVVGIAAADRLHIARDEWVSTDSLGLGGRDRRRLGRPGSLSLGGVPLRRHTVAADNSVVVGPIPDNVAGVPIAGLLGQDFLSTFDLDLDAAAGTLALYDVSGCSGGFIPWAAQAHAIPAIRPVRNILALAVTVDGRPMEAELDSGAETTTLMAPAMEKLALQPGSGDTMQGFGPRSIAAHRLQITLRVGGQTLPGWPAVAAPVNILRSIDLLLGADWLRRQRVWISWATNQVFVADLTPH